MAESATKGENGQDVDGYRNYRGVMVVGAWDWLPQLGMGVATEVSRDEAFEMLYMLRKLFLVLFTMLVLSGVGIFAFTLAVGRLETSLRKSALAARRLGQYVLLEEIGRGANGMVYRAQHTLLRRPVAIKLLSPDLTDDSNTAKFEHEVQMTSQLTHPNTVAIYDYGRTPEGLFYYAMEFLGGIDLDQLVRQFGPQPEGRVIYILRQVCGSLAEAHGIGLIHRDIKPANVVLTCRGGVCDVVKVLDFGLVKAVSGAADSKRTQTIVGTPHFMSPEAINSPGTVDARSDIYSVGALGYWLLTGRTLFDSEHVEELLVKQVKEEPLSLSERTRANVCTDLEDLVMRCLAKRPEDRPATADGLEQALAQCAGAGSWTREAAEQWWRANVLSRVPQREAALLERTLVIAPRG
jgi:serine/threonine protein kinase